MQARAESDEEEADVSEAAVSMTLHEARSAGSALKIFARRPPAPARRLGEVMLLHLQPIEDLISDMDAMMVSARTQQTRLNQILPL